MIGVSQRRRWWLVAACGALLALGCALAPSAAAEALAYLLPALLLLGTLAARLYPGERTLLSLIGRARRRGGSRAAAVRPASLCPRALLPRGGRLLAFSLAVRPPPVRATVLG